jgi:dienelactone hydrolase
MRSRTLFTLLAAQVAAGCGHAQSSSSPPRQDAARAPGLVEGAEAHHGYPTVNGVRYHYVQAGRGPLVVLLHGFPGLWFSWRHQLAAISKAGYRVVAPDLRGFGESQVTESVADYSLVHLGAAGMPGRGVPGNRHVPERGAAEMNRALGAALVVAPLSHAVGK